MLLGKAFAAAALLANAHFAALAPPPPRVPTERDLVAIAEAFNGARNRHDLEATLAFFAARARVHLGDAEITDRHALRAWLGGLNSHGYHAQTSHYVVRASTVRWEAEVDLDPFASVGVRAHGVAEATLEAGQIVLFTPVMENSAEWRREAMAALRTRAHTIHEAPAPVPPPTHQAAEFGSGARLPVYLTLASVVAYAIVVKRCRR